MRRLFKKAVIVQKYYFRETHNIELKKGHPKKLPIVTIYNIVWLSFSFFLLPHSQCSLENVASALGKSVRTLQSHLAVQGTTFQEVSDEVRLLLAEKYLIHSDLNIGQIAELLQFSETSSFTRFFKSHQVSTPRKYRQANQQELRERGTAKK